MAIIGATNDYMFQRVPFIPAVYHGCHFKSHFLRRFSSALKKLRFSAGAIKKSQFWGRS